MRSFPRWLLVCLLALVLAISLAAQSKMNLDQLREMISSSLALKHDDKKIAEYLKHVELSEKLDDAMIEQFMAMGAGARTIHELQVLRDKTANLKPKMAPPSQDTPAAMSLGTQHEYKPIPPPDSVKQAQILDLMREYALNYTKSLPNFLCLQVTDRFVYVPRYGRDIKIDKLVAQVAYNEGHETYKQVSRNGQYQFGDENKLGGGGSVSSGEFGSLLSKVFEPASEAQFEWARWGTLRGKRVAVYSYYIDSGHSSFTISYNNEQHIVTAYRGEVMGDPDTGEITRVKFEAVDIPAGFPVKEAVDILDYGEVQISGNPYICPLKADLRMLARSEHGEQKTHNEINFKLYQKFGTESTIKFDTADINTDSQPDTQPNGAPANAPGTPPPPSTDPTPNPPPQPFPQ